MLTNNIKNKDWSIFISSIFFVLGFSVVFSIVGVLLQTLLSHVGQTAEIWLGRIGGVIIIFFGLFLLDLVVPRFLATTHKISVKRKFKSYYLTSFVFGAAFAVGWTPCVSAALGAILALATTQMTGAFILLFSYTIGIGVPFLLFGLFTNQAQNFIDKAGKWITYFQYFFGALLIIMGILIFTGDLSKIANFQVLTNILTSLNFGTSAGANINSLNLINIAIAFLAGLGSFLSPCILPIIPGFLSYLASTSVNNSQKQNEEFNN